jgi:membrane protein required for colicin V production
VVLVFSTLLGAWKGMAWQLASLGSIVASCFVAVRFGGALAPYFSVQEPWNRCIAMLVLYVGTSLVIWLLFRLVAGLIDRVRLREFDHQLGALFGAAKGVLWCILITFFAVMLSETARQAVLRSRSGYYTARVLHRATPLLPDEIREPLGGYLEQFQQKLQPDGGAAPQPATVDSAGATSWIAATGRENVAAACSRPPKGRLLTGFPAAADRT